MNNNPLWLWGCFAGLQINKSLSDVAALNVVGGTDSRVEVEGTSFATVGGRRKAGSFVSL